MRTLERFEAYGNHTTALSKHCAIASQINIKPHTRDLFTLLPVVQHTVYDCKNMMNHARRHEKTLPEEKRPVLKQDSDMT